MSGHFVFKYAFQSPVTVFRLIQILSIFAIFHQQNKKLGNQMKQKMTKHLRFRDFF